MSRCEQRLVALLKKFFCRMRREYLIASAYFRRIGAQTPSIEYGGSRSYVYHEMMEKAEALKDFWKARRTYRACHADGKSNHDEFGGVLRIVAYRLRAVPFAGIWLERKVRADDALMKEAAFTYPPGCTRLYAPIDDIS